MNPNQPLPPISSRGFGLAAAALALLSSVGAAQVHETITVSAASTAKVSAMLAAAGPEHDWNHMDITIAERSFAAIVPNDLHGDPERITEILIVTKALIPEIVFAQTGLIGSGYANGTIAAVELQIFPEDPSAPPQASECTYIAELVDPQANSLGFMYAFTEAQYEARVELVAILLGFPLDAHTIWLGPGMHTRATGSRALRISGINNVLYGDAETAGTFRLEGSNHLVADQIRYGVSAVITGTGHTYNPPVLASASALPSPAHAASWYASKASTSGTHFAGNVTIVSDGQGGLETSAQVAIPSGSVVYSTGEILIGEDDLTGSVTLVAERGVIFASSGCALEASHDDLLAWSLSTAGVFDISVTGNGNALTGACYAPSSEFEVVGSGNDLTGKVVASSATLGGGANVVSDGTR